MSTSITSTVEISATPEQLAALFWAMDSGKQAQFFLALAAETKASREKYVADKAMGKAVWSMLWDDYGTGQWCYLREDLLKIDGGTVGEATKALQALAAPVYLHWRGEF